MKIKAAEIARQLGLSKATVSLALNNKPGVSPKTKTMILDYINQMEYGVEDASKERVIRIIICFQKLNLSFIDTINLWEPVIKEFIQEAKKDNFTVVVDYVDVNDKEEVHKSIVECQKEYIDGVILMGFEMTFNDYLPFRTLNKPMIIYDNDFHDDHSCVMIDNAGGIKKCIDYYLKKGFQEIYYFANDDYNYNFLRRRDAYLQLRVKYGFAGDIVMVGSQIENICENIKENYGKKYQAIICENFAVSIGTIKALKEMKKKIGEEVLLIGIDEIPDYFSYGYKLTTIKITHAQRAFITMALLKQEIALEYMDKFKVYSTCEFIKGDTA